MKMKRVVAMMLLFACLFNVIIAGFSEQQSSSPIIQAVVPYLNSWDKGMGQGDGSNGINIVKGSRAEEEQNRSTGIERTSVQRTTEEKGKANRQAEVCQKEYAVKSQRTEPREKGRSGAVLEMIQALGAHVSWTVFVRSDGILMALDGGDDLTVRWLTA